MKNKLKKIISTKKSTWLQDAEYREKHSHCIDICNKFYLSAIFKK